MLLLNINHTLGISAPTTGVFIIQLVDCLSLEVDASLGFYLLILYQLFFFINVKLPSGISKILSNDSIRGYQTTL